MERSCRNQVRPRVVNEIPGRLVGSFALKLALRGLPGVHMSASLGTRIRPHVGWLVGCGGRIGECVLVWVWVGECFGHHGRVGWGVRCLVCVLTPDSHSKC